MSSFQTVPYDIVGGFNAHRTRAWSSQTLKMMFPEIDKNGSKTPTAILSFPGLTSRYTGTSGADRGCHVMNDILYKVEGTTLYKVDDAFSATSLGTIAGTAQCHMSDDGTNLIISTGSKRYQYDSSTPTLSEFTDPNHQPGNSSAYINLQMVYDGSGQAWSSSDVGDPDSINGLNIATAESKPDNCTRVIVKDSLLYLMGPKSIEPWYNTGSGNPPFSRINQNVRGIGIASPHAVSETSRYLYFLSGDYQVYKFRSFIEESVTPTSLAKVFKSYSTIADAKFSSANIDGMYVLFVVFPTAGKTWAYFEDSEAWVELTDTNLETRHPMNSYVFAYNKHLVCDYNNGSLYELDFDAFTNDGNIIIRERIGKPFDSLAAVGKGGLKLVMRRMRILAETAVGVGGSGQGADPQLMISLSFDGGKSYTNERTVRLGRNSEGRLEAVYDHKEAFYTAIPRIRMSDPARLSIMGASWDVKLGGSR